MVKFENAEDLNPLWPRGELTAAYDKNNVLFRAASR